MNEISTDRELNFWIYEHLFGAKWYVFTQKIRMEAEHLKNEEGRFLYETGTGAAMCRRGAWTEASGDEPINAEEMNAVDVPNYCGSISEAWKVVNRMVESPDGAEDVPMSNNWFVEWFKNSYIFALDGESAARLICEQAKEIYESRMV